MNCWKLHETSVTPPAAQDRLGAGGFGSVYRAVKAETGEVTAVKFIPKSTMKEFEDLQRTCARAFQIVDSASEMRFR